MFVSGSVAEGYWNKVRDGQITVDKSQLKVVDILDDLQERLKSYVVVQPNFLSKVCFIAYFTFTISLLFLYKV